MLLLTFVISFTQAAWAGVPSWLQQLRSVKLPEYPPTTNAVMLLNERVTSINDRGEVKQLVRCAFKILRTEGKGYATAVAYFDNETQLTYLKAWSISQNGTEYESKEKDAVETQPFAGEFYSDTHLKMLRPAVQAGSIVGYEIEQKARPSIFEDLWALQNDIPVLTARYTLEIPGNWKHEENWMNLPPVQAVAGDKNRKIWEVHDLPAVVIEPNMPAWRSLAGQMGLRYFPGNDPLHQEGKTTWVDVSKWYSALSSPQRDSNPELKRRVAELTGTLPTTTQKVRALATFVQAIRYVAIEVGIGGYLPHPASQVLAKGYGDCKDKATLLSAMLKEIGVDSYYILAHSQRNVVTPDFPTVLHFNHVILGVKMPADFSDSVHSGVKSSKLGPLLLFDPTDGFVPLGYLSPDLQSSFVLLVDGGSGELIKTPLSPPESNMVSRTAKAKLSPAGVLEGELDLVYRGISASQFREKMQNIAVSERDKSLERAWVGMMENAKLKSVTIDHLMDREGPVTVHFNFSAEHYGQRVSDLLLFRPHLAGKYSLNIEEPAKRLTPLELWSTMSREDVFEIAIPPGFAVDELAAPMKIANPWATYEQKSEQGTGFVKMSGHLQITDVYIPQDKVEDVRKFIRQVDQEATSNAVLKVGPH